MLITTGKKPGKKCRAIAYALCLAVPESRLEFRGKRTLSSLIAKAGKLHFTRFCSIHCMQGKPYRLVFFSIGEEGWKRLSPSILVKSASVAKKFSSSQSHNLRIFGPKAKALLRLIGQKNAGEGEEPSSFIFAGKRSISISLAGKKAVSLGVSYEKRQG